MTGAGGLLGQKLCSQLAGRKDFDLIAAVRKPTGKEKVFTVTLDISEQASALQLVHRHRPQFVVNCAAMTQVDDCETRREQCWAANVTGVQNLVQASESVGAQLIHVSTDFVFDGSHGPLSEEEAPRPVNYYGQTKLEGEKLVMKSSVPWAIVRTVLVYGVTDDPSRSNIVLWAKSNLELHKPLRVVNDQFRTPTLAEDLAAGIVLIIENGAQGIFHISGKDMLTPYQIAMRVARHFHLDESLITETDSGQFRQPAQRPLKTGFIIDKAVKELGYRPHSFEEALAMVGSQLANRTAAST